MTIQKVTTQNFCWVYTSFFLTAFPVTVPTTIQDLIEALSNQASIIIQISGLQSDTKEEMTSSTIKLRALTDHSQVLCVVKAMYVAALKDPAVTDAQRNEIAHTHERCWGP